MTFWPRFPICRNHLGNLVEVKDMLTSRPAPSTEFRGGSCLDSQIGWRPNIFKVLPGCIKAYSKTPIHLQSDGGGICVGMGWRWVAGMGGRDGWARNVFPFPLFVATWRDLSTIFRYFALFASIFRYLPVIFWCFQIFADIFRYLSHFPIF